MNEQVLVERLLKIDELVSKFGELSGELTGVASELGHEITYWLDMVKEQYNAINILSGALEDERIARIRAENALHAKD